MLSVCIPVYRYDVRPLVRELLAQAAKLEGEIEVMVYDDASPDDEDWGRETLGSMQGVRYVALPQNLGRAAIRNKMAREATFDHLLLLDADGWPTATFLATYANWLQEKKGPQPFVCVGGRAYAEATPEAAVNLHWFYGHKRETPSVAARQREPYLGFQSNNFLTTKDVLRQFPFPEEVAGYGHEDTLWGQQLEEASIELSHLENPVIHLGLEANDVFLQKQREAIRNLALLHQQYPHLRTRLIDLVTRYPFVLTLAKIIPESQLVQYLTSRQKPSLYALDLLKLKWWSAFR